MDLSFQPQKQCAYIFINGMEFFPEPILVETHSMSCVIESKAEGRVRQTADTAVKQKQKRPQQILGVQQSGLFRSRQFCSTHTMASRTHSNEARSAKKTRTVSK